MIIDHLSASQINMYQRCSLQYFFRYCEGIRKPPRGAMTLGSAFHFGVAHNYRHKAQTHADLPVSDVIDAFSTDFDRRTDETEWDEGEDPGKVKDKGVITLAEYHRVVAPVIQPLDVEQEFVMRFKGLDYTFVGIADVITETAVVETKTTGRKLSTPRHDHLVQTWAYSTGLSSAENGRIDYAVNKDEPVMLTFEYPISQADRNYFLSLMSRTAKAIQAEIWIPNRNSILCSRKWCGYSQNCIKLAGGRVRD